MKHPMNPHVASVMKPNEYGTQAIRFQEGPTTILMAYPRKELMFMSLTEDTEERFFVGSVPEMSPNTGRSIVTPKGDGRGTSTIGDDIKIPAGNYIVESVPEYMNGVDWYELVPVTEAENLLNN